MRSWYLTKVKASKKLNLKRGRRLFIGIIAGMFVAQRFLDDVDRSVINLKH